MVSPLINTPCLQSEQLIAYGLILARGEKQEIKIYSPLLVGGGTQTRK